MGDDAEQGHLHVGEGRGDVGDQTDRGLSRDPDLRLKFVFVRGGGGFPRGVDPAMQLVDVFHPRDHVRAVPFVDRDAVALGDEADDRIAGERRAAFGKFDRQAVDAVDDDAAAGLFPLDGGDLVGLLRKDLLGFYDAVEFVAELGGDFGNRQAAVADDVIEIVDLVDADALADIGEDLGFLRLGEGAADSAHLALDLGPADDDVFRPLFLFEPLPDLVARLSRADDLHPVAGRAVGRGGGQDLDDLAVLDHAVDRNDHAVDFGADHLVADLGVDGVGKIDDRRALRQGDDVALRRKDKDLVVHDVDFERPEEFLGIAGVVLGLDELGDPAQLAVDLLLALLAGFIFPVRGNAVFGDPVHLPGPDLDLEGDRVAPDDGCVERAVHIGLRRGDIVLEASGDHAEQLVDQPEDDVAFLLGVDDDAERVKIKDFVEALVLLIHLAVDGIDRLDPALERKRDAGLGELIRDAVAGVFDKIAAFAVAFFDVGLDLLVADRVEKFQRQVFQLLLHALHSEAVGERGVDLHRIMRGGAALFILTGGERPHIVEPVAKLDEDDADVLRHGEEHLSQVFDMRLFLVLERDLDQLCQAVDQLRHVVAEFFFDGFERDLGTAILDRIVQQGGADRVGVERETGRDLGNGHGVADIFLAAVAILALMEFFCV